MSAKLSCFLFLPMIFPALTFATADAGQEFYELRIYRNESVDKQSAVLSYLKDALVPALNRSGSETIGVFVPVPDESGQPSADVYVLIPYANLDRLTSLRETLLKDDVYQQAAADFLNASKKDARYTRVENRLMKAFAGMPQLAVPSSESPDRILELRIYESHNEDKARLKVEMFNEGEIDIMKDVDLAPVFFAETLISSDVPNLTYMLSADNADVHKQHFQAFLQHPDWKRMSKMEKYKGTVSKIRRVFLKPADGSQI